MRIHAVLAVLAAIASGAEPVSAQRQPRDIPSSITGTVRAELETEKMRILLEQTAISDQADAHNRRCELVHKGSNEDVRCIAEQQKVNARIVLYDKRIDSFDSAVAQAETAAAGKDAVQNEQADLDANPDRWVARQTENVRNATASRWQWRRDVMKAVEQGSAGQYQLTNLSELTPGDVLLIAPAHIQDGLKGAAVSGAVVGGDYLIRATSDFAAGRLFSTDAAPASHVVTFVRATGERMLFLDHTRAGSRILDERQFLKMYGSRPMFVARPEAVVDGRMIWNAARQAALRGKSDYGLFGKNVVCSERAGIAVARATGLPLTNGRIGPVDITPGDFFDRRGDVGKHFVVTQLRITPTAVR